MLDYSMILTSLLQLWWLLPIIIVILFFKSPIGKGIMGESLLNFLIGLTLNKEKYRLLKDVTLRTEDGTTQIDHIIVSEHGVFVIETKNYKGWIFGNEQSRTWTQNIYGKKHSFQNPLHQNYKHLKELQKLLDLDDDQIFSVVVFIGEATFKTDMPNNVVYPFGLIKFIRSHQITIFTQRDIWKIVEMIEDAQLDKGFTTNREHVQNLRTRSENTFEAVKVKRELNNNDNCPRCGNDLIIRTAKRGKNIGSKFYGCKSYPRCKYTKNIEEEK